MQGSVSRSSKLDASVCSFWLGPTCFGLDVALVGEVVTVESVTQVPIARPAMRGLFNLRGTPVVLVDLAEILEVPATEPNEGSGGAAIVLRSGDMVVGMRIDRMEAVIPSGRGAFVFAEEAGDHPVVRGFLTIADGGSRVVTVLDPGALLERLNGLRYLGASEDARPMGDRNA